MKTSNPTSPQSNKDIDIVLIIDDDSDLEKKVKKLLRSIDPRIQSVWLSEPAKAIHFLENSGLKPTVILIDIFLPGNIDGVGFWDYLRENGFEIPVVFMSSLSSPGYYKAMRKRPFTPPFLEKPFKETDARKVLLSTLRKQQAA